MQIGTKVLVPRTGGGFALIIAIGVLVNMVVNISAGLPAMFSAW